MAEIVQVGLQWEYKGVDIVPNWTTEPELDTIKQIALATLKEHAADISSAPALQHESPDPLHVEAQYLAQGAFNKLYTVKNDILGDFVFRVALPVDPFFKTESEVATLQFLYNNTNVPVPEVIAHDSSAHNQLGFEWIMMRKIPGVALSEVWATMTLSDKENITRTIAKSIVALQQHRFSLHGSLYREEVAAVVVPHESLTPLSHIEHGSGEEKGRPQYVVGRIVSTDFFRQRRVLLKADRGPYATDEAWMAAWLGLMVARLDELGPDPEQYDELDEDVDKSEEALAACKNLLDEIPRYFPTRDVSEESGSPRPTIHGTNASDTPNTDPAFFHKSFVLYHHDLSTRNIMIDPETYQLHAIVDWECIETTPLWMARSFPRFLQSRDREVLPPPEQDDPCANDARDDWEKTQLRKAYVEVLEELGHPVGPRPEDLVKQKFLDTVAWVDEYPRAAAACIKQGFVEEKIDMEGA